MQRLFSTGDLLEVSGMPRATVQSYLHRADFVIDPAEVDGGDGTGKHRRYTRAAVMHFAVAAELIRKGIAVKPAFQAAARFAYLGEAQEGNLPTDNRPPACPFHHSKGRTLLIILPGQAEQAQVIAVARGVLRLSDVPEDETGLAAFFALDVGQVFARTVRALGIDPDAELRAVYGEAA